MTAPGVNDLRELVVPMGTILTDESPIYVLCPVHDDQQRPSMRVYERAAHCFTCGAHLSREEFLERFTKEELMSALVRAGTVRRARAPERPRIDLEAASLAAHQTLLTLPTAQRWLFERGLLELANGGQLARYRLGHNGVAYVLPVFGRLGRVLTLRYRRDDAVAPELMKYWGLRGYNDTLLYPNPVPTTEGLAPMTIALTEGEFDALLLRRYGVEAYSLTNGAAAVPRDLGDLLAGVGHVVLVRDQDKAGREGTERLRCALETDLGLQTTDVCWDPGPDNLKDATLLWQRDVGRHKKLVERLKDLGC